MSRNWNVMNALKYNDLNIDRIIENHEWYDGYVKIYAI